MRQRYMPLVSPFFNTDQHRSCTNPAMGQSYIHMDTQGRSVAPNHGSFPHSMDNFHGFSRAFQQNLESISVQHSTSSISRSAQVYTPFTGLSCGIIPQCPPGGNYYPMAEINASHSHSAHYDRNIGSDVEGGLQDHTLVTTSGSFKRKRHGSSASWGRGGRSGSYGEGSSSNGFNHQCDKAASDYRFYTSGFNGLPRHMNNNSPVAGECYPRNVRSRSILDLGHDMSGNNSSSHSSGSFYTTSEPLNATNINASASALWQNHSGACYAPRWFQSSAMMNRETNHYNVEGSLPDTRRYPHQSIMSRNHAAAPHHGFPAQSNRERQANHFQRALLPQGANSDSFVSGQEAAVSATGQWFLPASRSSRYQRPMPASGQHRSHRERTPRMAIERLQSLSNSRDEHDRLGAEGVMILDRSRSYDPSYLSDQYRDMRLDVDNMSYEELLALGDRIGKVNTGLSEDAILKCLTIRPFSTLKQEELSCVICLEEYSNLDKVGTLRNCAHDYHMDCINKWLSMKNACPICKAPAVADTPDSAYYCISTMSNTQFNY